MDYLQSLGYLGLTSRIKRMSDRLMHEGRLLYKLMDPEMEPNWFLVFKILDEKGYSTVTDISRRLGFAHPSVITIVKKMKAQGYLNFSPNKDDLRVQEIRLSKKGQDKMDTSTEIWAACERGVQSLFESSGVSEALSIAELAMNDRSFYDRVKDTYLDHALELIDFDQKHTAHFKQLNQTWIESYFELEPGDHKVLNDPQAQIINKGGKILVAQLAREVVGTVALLTNEGRIMELGRMAVDPQHQGKGIGRRLMQAILDSAAHTCDQVILYTNDALIPAVHLYRSFGFVEVPIESDINYRRANMKMALDFNQTNLIS